MQLRRRECSLESSGAVLQQERQSVQQQRQTLETDAAAQVQHVKQRLQEVHAARLTLAQVRILDASL